MAGMVPAGRSPESTLVLREDNETGRANARCGQATNKELSDDTFVA